jgi:hypothetical protein
VSRAARKVKKNKDYRNNTPARWQMPHFGQICGSQSQVTVNGHDYATSRLLDGKRRGDSRGCARR